MTTEKQLLLGKDDLAKAMTRMAHELIEKAGKVDDLALIGIRSRGVHIARRLARKIEELTNQAPPVGIIDVTLFRDDRPRDQTSAPAVAGEISVAVENKIAVLVDDVIFRGRTIRAAMEAVERLGQSNRILLVVLIDRGSRELPIRADIVGRNVEASDTQRVNVLLEESDGIDQVVVTPWDSRNVN
ncbi:MAG: bifunctional pyr operon transcriptional regulator/uracil phosphoribosyltransferase PyrR [Candidatus Binatia bacterium]